MVRNGSFGSTRSRDDYRFLDEAEDRFDHFQRDLLTSDLDNTPYRQAQIRSGQRVRKARGDFFRRTSIFILEANS